ncbi:MAG: thiamine pyrophosphate-dependent enzyme, partial [Anaerolineae bacterium]|nr:thiamine pyrophosphate-dependent enzyme [Anaerolineae bacterium]
MNQGMLLESFNLASVWKLPVLFVCKDDGWSITTQSKTVTGGDLNTRARGLGIPAVEVDGGEVTAVWRAAQAGIERARSGQGPTFLHAHCIHLEAHFLGFQLLRIARHPLKEMPEIAAPLTRSFLHPGGAALTDRLAGLKGVVASIISTFRDPREDARADPILRTRKKLLSDPVRLQQLEDQIEQDISHVLTAALKGVAS